MGPTASRARPIAVWTLAAALCATVGVPAAFGSPALDNARQTVERAAGLLARLVIDYEATGDAAAHKKIAEKAEKVLDEIGPAALPPLADPIENRQLGLLKQEVLDPVLKRWRRLGAPATDKAEKPEPPGKPVAAKAGAEAKFECPKGAIVNVKPEEAFCVTPDHKRHGPWIFYYGDGKKKAESNWKEGKRDGVRRVWTAAGVLREEEYFGNDEPNGTTKKWTEKGVLVEEFNFVNGKRHGPSTWWYDDGKPKEKAVYANGKRNGVSRRWHATGNVADEAAYEDGKLNGPRKQWTVEGQLIAASCYRADRETWRTEDPAKVKDRPCD